jgi:formylglycine-generating enzyme required for sulfatase activity
VLEARISQSGERSFASSLDRWWHDQLARLVHGLRDLDDPEHGLLAGRSARHGWGVARRREWAQTIAARSLEGEEARRRWAEAIASIRDERVCPMYRGFELAPQLGLLPIGQDPESGLWEFAHLQSGEPAERGADGRLVLSEDTALVLVLLPGGDSWLGGQKDDPLGPNYDRDADKRETPVVAVPLAPFFLSKYEMTQGQWLRATGENPSKENPSSFSYSWSARVAPFDLLHPVEEISWNDCQVILVRLGLCMPTEAQWEYAARGGTSTPWWTGAEASSLQGAANLSDRYMKEHGGDTAWEANGPSDLWLDDGSSVHASVGGYRPNPFGLHDMFGNLSEWCRDGYRDYDLEPRDADGERQMGSARMRSQRGGCFLGVATAARSSSRNGQDPEFHQIFVGVRPSLSLAQPEASTLTFR